jgi:hypothetical protein
VPGRWSILRIAWRFVLLTSLPVFAAASLAALVFYFRSRHTSDIFGVWHRDDPSIRRCISISAWQGSVCLSIQRFEGNYSREPRWEYASGAYRVGSSEDMGHPGHQARRLGVWKLGFVWARVRQQAVPVPMVERLFAAPLWLVAIMAAAPPSASIFARVRRKRRAKEGRCPECGYDLRATPQRCPECGHIPASLGLENPTETRNN